MTATRPAARTAAEIGTLYPELTAGVAVTVFTDWSRGQETRVAHYPGTVVGPARNGYVVVRDTRYGTTMHHDPRDLAVAP